jgi:hypothetical protein
VATVTALQSFVGVFEKDVVDKPRIVHTSLGTDTFPGKVLKEGRSIQVVKGQNFDSNHPAVKKWPEMFGGVEQVHGPVEQATAAPGEKRSR